MATADQSSAEVEVEWQLDAIDLRPVERWLAARGARAAGRAGTRRPRPSRSGQPPSAPAPTATADGAGGGTGPREGSGERLETEPLPLLASVPGLEAVAQPVKRLLDLYYDTPDWRLGRSGYVLRTRQRAGRYEATLKDLVPSTSGLRRRLEATEPISSADPAGLDPAGPVGRRVHALLGARPLAQVLEVRTRRRTYALEVRGTAVGEVALDDTVIVTGEEHHRIRLQRVEVEVLPAWVDSISPLVERLRHDCGLQPAALSKFEAGLLGAGFVIPRLSDLGPTTVSPSSTLSELAYAVLRKDAVAMIAHEAGTRLGEDIESLHQMRVATRRMRAALTLFQGVLPARAVRVHEELGWLAGVLGRVRDLDIQLSNLDGWTEELAGLHRQALDELGDLLMRHREAARAALLEALDSRRYERLVAALTSMLDQGPGRRPGLVQVPALEALPELIRGRHRDAEKAVRRAHRTGLLEDFHRLRIRCKRLRYAIEFTGDLYGGDVRRYARRVASLQDDLGLIQDAETAAHRLQEIALGEEGAALPRETVFAMGMVSQRCAAEALSRLAKLPEARQLVNGRLWDRTVDQMERRQEEAAARGVEGGQANGTGPVRRHAVPGRARPALPGHGRAAAHGRVGGHGRLPRAGRVAHDRAPGTGESGHPAEQGPPPRSNGGPVPREETHEPADTTVTPIRRGLAPG